MIHEMWDRVRSARHLWRYAAIVALSVAALCWHGISPSVQTPERSALEARLESLISGLDGVEEVSLMISEDDQGRPVGVVVIADVADMRAYLNIQSAVRTLLDIDLERIKIIDGGGGGIT